MHCKRERKGDPSDRGAGAETKFRWRASQAKGSSVRSRTRRRQIKSLGLAASSYLASSDGK